MEQQPRYWCTEKERWLSFSEVRGLAMRSIRFEEPDKYIEVYNSMSDKIAVMLNPYKPQPAVKYTLI